MGVTGSLAAKRRISALYRLAPATGRSACLTTLHTIFPLYGDRQGPREVCRICTSMAAHGR